VKWSQSEQARRGRTIRFTRKRPGRYSNSSVTSSPIRRSVRIASPEMLLNVELLPHLKCSLQVICSGDGDEAGEHGSA